MDEYRNLIDTARRHLRLEVSSLRPELAATLDAAHIGADELNILMAHAYWKILTLQKELSRQQALEQQRLLSAVDVQRREDEHVMESRLRVEMEKQYYELKAQFSQEMALHEKNMSDQWTQQMKRQAAAHTHHLNDQLAAQHDNLSAKHQMELQLQAAQHQLALLEQLAPLVGAAQGVRDGVERRAELDAVARRVRTLWSSAQALIDALSTSAAHLPWQQQRCPLAAPLALLSGDEFVQQVVQSVPKEAVENGVLPTGAIKERFLDVERVCRRVALIDENGGSLIRYALSYLQSMLMFQSDIRQPPSQQVDVDSLDTYAILARTRYHLEKDDLESALRFMNLLRGEPLLVAGDWLREVRLHLETVQAARAVLAYAAAAAIESM